MAETKPNATDETAVADTTPALDAGAAATSPPRVDVPTRLGGTDFEGRYEIQGEIARGGMGVVLDARDLALRRSLAMKRMLAGDLSADAYQRFIGEAQIQGQLEHPNICPIHELGFDSSGKPFFTMKRVRGRSLESVLEAIRGGDREVASKHSLFALLQIFVKVCDAIAYAHSRGVIHRDLKPANIMIGEFGEAIVMDWGIAKIIDAVEPPAFQTAVTSDRSEAGAALTGDGAIIGSPQWMAPEQALGRKSEITERSDVYALGAVLYSILTLVPPIETASLARVLVRVAENDIVPPAKRAPSRMIPPDVEAAAMKALAKDPGARYPSATALKDDVVAFLEGRALSAARYSAWQLARKWVARNRALAFTIAASTLILLLGAAAYVMQMIDARALDRRRLAEGLVIQGNALALAGRHGASKDAYRRSGDLFRDLDRSARTADLARWLTYGAAPPPLLTFTDHPVLWRDISGWFGDIDVSEDGKHAVTAAESGVIIWDVITGRERARIPVAKATALRIVKNQIIAGAGGISIWELESGTLVRSIELPVADATPSPPRVLSLDLSPDGTKLLVVTLQPPVLILDSVTGEKMSALEGHTARVYRALFSRDGRTILTSASDGTVRLWDAITASELRTLWKGANAQGIAYSDDGTLVAAAFRGGAVSVWSAEDGAQRAQLQIRGAPSDIAFTPDASKLLVRVESEVVVYELASKAQASSPTRVLTKDDTASNKTWGRSIAIFDGGARVATAGLAGTIDVWSLEGSDPEVHVATIPSKAQVVTAGQVGSRLAIVLDSRGSRILQRDLAFDVKLADAGSPDELRASAAKITRDEQRAVVAGDNWFAVREVSTGREVVRFETASGWVRAADLSEDGRWVALATWSHTVEIWDLSKGKRATTIHLPGHAPPQTAVYVAIVTRDNRLLTCSRGYLFVYEIPSGRQLATADAGMSWVQVAALSGDERMLATSGSDGVVRLWSLDRSGLTEIDSFTGHSGSVQALDISGDGTLLASGGDDRIVRLWDLASRTEIGELTGHTAQIEGVRFSNDAGALVSYSKHEARVWKLDRVDRHREHDRRIGADASDAFALLGERYAFLHAWKEALACFDAYDAHRGKASHALQRAQASFALGRTEDAIEALGRSVESGELTQAEADHLASSMAICEN